jgi:hypothetical protein
MGETEYSAGPPESEHQIGARELIADLERRIAELADVVAPPPPGEERPE